MFKYFCVGNLMSVQLRKLFMIFQASNMQKLGFLEHAKAPILIYGADSSTAPSEQRHCHADRSRHRSATPSITTTTAPDAAHTAFANLLCWL
jgi:hypothetical protein